MGVMDLPNGIMIDWRISFTLRASCFQLGYKSTTVWWNFSRA